MATRKFIAEINIMKTIAVRLAALKKQQEALAKKEQALKATAHAKVLAKIVQLAKDAGLLASDIAKALNASKPAKAKPSRAPKAGKKTGPRRKVAPKYHNPENHAETWTGRGLSPKWVAKLKASGRLESALIKHGAPTSH